MRRALTLACLLLLSMARTEAAPPSGTPTTVYDPGWVVSLHPVEKYQVRRDRLIGKFVETENPFNLGAHRDKADLSFYRDPVAYTLKSFFESKQSGTYTFVAEIGYPATTIYRDAKNRKGRLKGNIDCDYRLLMGKQELVSFSMSTKKVSNTDKICGFSRQIVGSVELEPGLNEIALEFGCIGIRGGYQARYGNVFYRPAECRKGGSFEADAWAGDEVTVTLRLRRPGEHAPTLTKPEDFFHVTKPK